MVLTQITGPIYNSLGAVVTAGRLTVTLCQDIVSLDGFKVAPVPVIVDLAISNPIDISIVPTVGASPAGVAYWVTFDPDPDDTTKLPNQKAGYWENYWSVPNAPLGVPVGNFTSAARGTPFANYMPIGGFNGTAPPDLGVPLNAQRLYGAIPSACLAPGLVGIITDAHVAAGAAISWSKISKAGGDLNNFDGLPLDVSRGGTGDDLSATGDSGFVVQQESAGVPFTVGPAPGGGGGGGSSYAFYNEALTYVSPLLYRLAQTPIAGSVMIFVNGLLMAPGAGADYTISGDDVTFLFTPPTGANLRAVYAKAVV